MNDYDLAAALIGLSLGFAFGAFVERSLFLAVVSALLGAVAITVILCAGK